MREAKSILMIMFGRRIGGAELQFFELANYLANKYRVRLVCLGGSGSAKGATIDARIEVKVYNYSTKLAVIPMLFRAWLENLRFGPDVIVTTSVVGNCLGYLCGILRETRLVSLQTVSKTMNHASIERFVARKFHYLIAGANDVKDFLIARGHRDDQIKVVQNWVDFSRRITLINEAEAKRRFGFQTDIVIGCAGRLHAQKGQTYLIAAFSRFINLGGNGLLVLAGDGPERKTLEAEIARLGLKDKVVFVGEITGDDYNAFFKAVDIYVQPSIFEGLPRTLLDAMFFGKAIIATDANGNREAIQNGLNGLLVPVADVETLHKGILALVNDPGLRSSLGAAAKKLVTEKFDMSIQLQTLEKLLCE